MNNVSEQVSELSKKDFKIKKMIWRFRVYKVNQKDSEVMRRLIEC